MHFTEHNLILFIFRFLLVLITFINGSILSQKKTSKLKFWDFLPTIIAYTLYAGLRWGRGTDYNGYYWTYYEIIKGNVDYEPIFNYIIKFFGFLKLEWIHFVPFMSFLLISSCCFFMKCSKQYLLFLLPICVLNLDFSENLMRWYMGFSFILFGLHFLIFKGKVFYFLLFSILGILVHYALIIICILFYLIWKIKKGKTLHPIVTITIILILYIFFSREYMGFFSEIIKSMSLASKFASYQENAEAWLTGTANEDIGTKMSLTNLASSFYFIIAGYYTLQKYPRIRENHIYTTLYNIAIFSQIIQPLSSQIELIMRINAPFQLIKALFLAFIFKEILINKKYTNKVIYYASILFILYTFIFGISKPLFLTEENTYFIWDSNGRKTL